MASHFVLRIHRSHIILRECRSLDPCLVHEWEEYETKTEIHVHLGGSTNLEAIRYAIRLGLLGEICILLSIYQYVPGSGRRPEPVERTAADIALVQTLVAFTVFINYIRRDSSIQAPLSHMVILPCKLSERKNISSSTVSAR